jgi:hypothetical protein
VCSVIGFILIGILLPIAVSWPQEKYESRLPEGDGKELGSNFGAMRATICKTWCHPGRRKRSGNGRCQI